MQNINTESDSTVQFNAFFSFYPQLFRVIDQKDQFMIENNYDNWNDCLVSLLNKVKFKIKQEEYELIITELNEVDQRITNLRKNGGEKSVILNRNDIKHQLRKLDGKIMDFINKNFLKSYNNTINGLAKYVDRMQINK